MTKEARIRRAKARDLPALVRFWRDLVRYHEDLGGQDFRLARGWDEHWRRFVRRHIGRRDKLCLVAEADGEAIGFLLGGILERPALFRDRRYGHIYDAYVEARHRRKGIGELLAAEALKWFEQRRISRVRLNVDARNALGVNFWKKMGFETTVHTMDRRV